MPEASNWVLPLHLGRLANAENLGMDSPVLPAFLDGELIASCISPKASRM